MRKIIPILLLLLILLPPGVKAQESGGKAPLVMTGHPDRPPFIYRDGKQVVGFGPDLAGIVLSNLGVAYQSRFMGPWKRVQELARQGQVDMIAGLYRNSEREIYLAISKKSPYIHLLPDINREIHKLRKESHIDRLIDRSLESPYVENQMNRIDVNTISSHPRRPFP